MLLFRRREYEQENKQVAGDQKGSVFILSLWALIMLALMSISATRRVSAQMALARHQIGKTRSRYAAVAGLFYALDRIRLKRSGLKADDADRAYACGISLDQGQTPEEIFFDQNIGDAGFEIRIMDSGCPGFEDETGKINVNALTARHEGILKILLTAQGVPEDQARVISRSIRTKTRECQGETVSSATGVPFKTPEEILLAGGMTEEIFLKIRPFITVYPQSGPLTVNFNTAPEEVLSALAGHCTGAVTKTHISDANDFVRAVSDVRNGNDGVWGTADDRAVVFGRAPFHSGPGLAIASCLAPVHSHQAVFLRARVAGADGQSRIRTVIDAVIDAQSLSVVFLRME